MPLLARAQDLSVQGIVVPLLKSASYQILSQIEKKTLSYKQLLRISNTHVHVSHFIVINLLSPKEGHLMCMDYHEKIHCLFSSTDLDLHVVDVPLGGGVPSPLPLGALPRRRRPRVELPPHWVRRPRRLAVLLELSHVDVVVAQQRVSILKEREGIGD